MSKLGLITRDHEVIERFIESCLVKAGVWDSARCSDGFEKQRVIEATPNRVRVAGHVWEIEGQVRKAYWLNLTLVDVLSWTLFFELSGTPRQRRQALDLHDRAEYIEWAHRFTGEATFEDGLVLRSLSPAA